MRLTREVPSLRYRAGRRKDFTITPGSYLRWDGQVDNPVLNVETTSKVRGSYNNPVDGKTREVDFLVNMKLANRLSQLEIVFDVSSPDQYITSVFNSLSADERMRQAINLLIFELIELPGQTSSTDYLTQQINQFWESQINQITKSAFRNVDVSLGIDTYTQATEQGEQAVTSFSYEVKKDMFKDRGSVMVSGHMNDNSPGSTQTSNLFENFIFEYALDTNRTKFIKVYRQQDYEDLLEGEVTKSGVGFIYRKNYDKLRDIWRRKGKSGKGSRQ
ncbi:MAG: translocation/assembly module TamB domain-containing protein [Bacteroidales bacterium]|nr:translocation/assembly module TamB domain-containing protein [Bacteroidales bacterium]